MKKVTYGTSILKGLLIPTLLIAILSFLTFCGKKTQILIDGSSTVYPISEAAAEEYRKINKSVHVTVGVSGTGGGFKKFCKGETDISNASRPIKNNEAAKCSQANIAYQEFPVAFDGLAVVVNKNNDFIQSLDRAALKKIFSSLNPAKTWKDVHPSWPALPIKIFAPGQDSGTHDYFVEVILGKKKKIRGDASFSEDDNVLVRGVSGARGAIGFFGLAYYQENKNKLKIVPVVNPRTGKAVIPTLETVKNNSYAPLSRPIFIYVSKKSYARKEVKDFVRFYLKNAGSLSKDVGYIPLAQEKVRKNAAALKKL